MQWLIELVADLVRTELAAPKAIGYFGAGAPSWNSGQTYTVIPNVIDYDPLVMFESDLIRLNNAAEAFYFLSWNLNLYPGLASGKYAIITVLLNTVEQLRWVRYSGSLGQVGCNGSVLLRCPQLSTIKLQIVHNTTLPQSPYLATRASRVSIFKVY